MRRNKSGARTRDKKTTKPFKSVMPRWSNGHRADRGSDQLVAQLIAIRGTGGHSSKRRKLGLGICIAAGMRREDAVRLVERHIAKAPRPYVQFLPVPSVG